MSFQRRIKKCHHDAPMKNNFSNLNYSSTLSSTSEYGFCEALTKTESPVSKAKKIFLFFPNYGNNFFQFFRSLKTLLSSSAY